MLRQQILSILVCVCLFVGLVASAAVPTGASEKAAQQDDDDAAFEKHLQSIGGAKKPLEDELQKVEPIEKEEEEEEETIEVEPSEFATSTSNSEQTHDKHFSYEGEDEMLVGPRKFAAKSAAKSSIN